MSWKMVCVCACVFIIGREVANSWANSLEVDLSKFHKFQIGTRKKQKEQNQNKFLKGCRLGKQNNLFGDVLSVPALVYTEGNHVDNKVDNGPVEEHNPQTRPCPVIIDSRGVRGGRELLLYYCRNTVILQAILIIYFVDIWVNLNSLTCVDVRGRRGDNLTSVEVGIRPAQYTMSIYTTDPVKCAKQQPVGSGPISTKGLRNADLAPVFPFRSQ